MNSAMTTRASKTRPLALLKWCPFWPAALLVALLFPTEFSFVVGSLRLTPYRIILIIAFIPSVMRLVSGKGGKPGFIDVLIIFHLIWSYIVIGHYHGFNIALESGGIRMLELGGAYLIARTGITNEKEFRGFVAFLLAIITFLLPFVVIEMITGFHVIKVIASKLTGGSFYSDIGKRLFLTRAYGSFDHPILLGVFSASALGMAWVRAIPRMGIPKERKPLRFSVIVTAVTSLSSGAIAALMTQFILLLWDAKTRNITARWKLLTTLIVFAYLAVDTISNRSGIKVFLHYLTFSAHTAYNRIIIFEFGIQDVWRNPVMGIGFNEWTKPVWMHSSSMDNFWLLQAVTFGIPGFVTLALPVILLLSKNWKNHKKRIVTLRKGWTISMIGIVLAASTVHLWNNLFVYFAFLAGTGMWFQTNKNNYLNSK